LLLGKRIFMPSTQVHQKVLHTFPDLIPGIEKVILVENWPDQSSYKGYILEKQVNEYETKGIGIDSIFQFIEDQMISKQPFQWFAKDQIPFKIVPKQKVQLTIFNELKNSVLNIIIQEGKGNHAALYFVFFNENLSNFLLDKINEPFSAQHKTMVGFLLLNAIKTLIGVFAEQERLAQDIQLRFQDIITERDRLQEQVTHQATQSRKDLIKMANHYLDQLTRNEPFQARLTESAIRKIREFDGELFVLEQILAEAISFAGTLSPTKNQKEVLLADYHIRFPEIVQREPTKPDTVEGLSERLVKTHLLLDKLERAASGLKERKVSLTSANVGRECPTPISAPAISDALKKHKKRIIQLFDQFPDKWEIIRNDFRPIQNILPSGGGNGMLNAS
jgi:hypothetical protein